MSKNNIDDKKLNAGCIKIFNFLQLLYDDKAYYDAVVDIFKDELGENLSNNIQVILNKHINTLKIFGIKIVKENHQYKLRSSLYSMDLTLDDLKSISILMSSIQDFPDKNLNENIKELIDSIQIRMKNEDKKTLNNLTNNSNYDFSFYYTGIREQINQCLDICNQSRMINILYLDKKKEKSLRCSAQEVLFESKAVSLKVYDPVTRQNFEIPLPNILSISKLPSVKSSVDLTQTVVFKLKNRLAKTYHMRPDEKRLDELCTKTETVIVNKGEPFDMLLSRLMRYSYNCEILSPKNFKDQMLGLINETLSNYDEPVTKKPDKPAKPVKKTKKTKKKKKSEVKNDTKA